MTGKFIASTLVAASLAILAVPALAAQQASVKMGYFNLAVVKASYPQAAGSEALKQQAESQLRTAVEAGNDRLKKMQDDKKPKEEIEKARHDLQIEINAMQTALVHIVQSQSASAAQAIAVAVSQVATEKGLDLVVDGAGVFTGGEKMVNNGDDITEAVVKKLQPQLPKPGK